VPRRRRCPRGPCGWGRRRRCGGGGAWGPAGRGPGPPRRRVRSRACVVCRLLLRACLRACARARARVFFSMRTNFSLCKERAHRAARGAKRAWTAEGSMGCGGRGDWRPGPSTRKPPPFQSWGGRGRRRRDASAPFTCLCACACVCVRVFVSECVRETRYDGRAWEEEELVLPMYLRSHEQLAWERREAALLSRLPGWERAPSALPSGRGS
jgi:hypothetical protein